ncbi:MAG: C25 family cysteine peptidase [Planctomycetota bacterium]
MVRRLLYSIILGVLLSVPLQAGVVEHAFSFASPKLTPDSSGFLLVEMEARALAGCVGDPALPFVAARLLLPPGEEAVAVEIVPRGSHSIRVGQHLFPMQPVRPVSAGPGTGGLTMNEASYAADRWYPEKGVGKLSTHYASGCPIATVCFAPLRYNPGRGEIRFHDSVLLRVHTRKARGVADPSDPASGHRGLCDTAAARARVAALVANPEGLQWYGAPAPSPSDDYELLIVTTGELSSAFTPLVDFYAARGIRAQIHLMGQIRASEPGIDDAEKVRNRIISEYTQHRIQYVLLGGDADYGYEIVPTRYLYCKVISPSAGTIEGFIPADLYFGNLDGDWNTDRDERWGEVGEEDFYAEVAVGRACVDTAADVATFVTKTTRYQGEPVVGDIRRALMLGEYLWDNPVTYGGPYMDELIGYCTHNGFTTYGIPPFYPIAKIYDIDLGPWGWDGWDVIAEVNAGRAFVNHLGHSNSDYNMRLSSWDVNDVNFTNDGINHTYSIVYTQGCIAGAFEVSECIGEKMVRINHFAVAFIGNSRYGWFTEGSTNGPSQHFHREFVDALFTPPFPEAGQIQSAEPTIFTRIGAAHAVSKNETVPFIDLPDEYEPGAHRWCFYTCNLLGDPAMNVWTDEPSSRRAK